MSPPTEVDRFCFLCGQAIGNTMVGCPEGLAHELCYYKRESERPRDLVVVELKARIKRITVGMRETTPCVICRWPRPFDNEHNICECCGFQEGYDSPDHYQWDGTWWDTDAPPPIVESPRRELAALRSACQALALEIGAEAALVYEVVGPKSPRGHDLTRWAERLAAVARVTLINSHKP